MKIELINPFLSASFSVLEMLVGNTPTKGELSVRQSPTTANQVNVICGVTGDITGQLVYGMSLQTADRIASKMIGQPIKTFDALAASAIAELGNMISGNGLQRLAEIGLTCDITPPTVVRGQEVEITTLVVPAIVVPFAVEEGEFTVTVGLQTVK